MKYYRISIDFGGDLDLKGKISASLLIRKMIERLSNEYETKVNSVQDTRCEIILKSDAAQDISEQLRGELAGMTGSMSCRILVELDDRKVQRGAPEALRFPPPPRPPSGRSLSAGGIPRRTAPRRTALLCPKSTPWWARRSSRHWPTN